MSDAVLIEEDGPVRILTMNRPEALNAFDGKLHHALPDALHEVSDDPKVRAVVLTGAGRTFSAGGNIGTDGSVNVGFGRSDRSLRLLEDHQYQWLQHLRR